MLSTKIYRLSTKSGKSIEIIPFTLFPATEKHMLLMKIKLHVTLNNIMEFCLQ